MSAEIDELFEVTRSRRGDSMPGYQGVFLGALLLALPCTVAAQPGAPGGPDIECTESADLLARVVRDTSTPVVSIPGFPISMIGSSSSLIISNACGGQRKSAITKFAWRLDAPAGSQAVLQNPTTLRVTFTPTVVGLHRVHLVVCPGGCQVRLRTGFTPTKKPIIEEVTVGPTAFTSNIDVVDSAQVAPLYVPGKLPKPFKQPNGTELVADTSPGDYSRARDFCGGPLTVGASLRAQWFTTTAFPQTAPEFALAEGRVYHTLVARKDHPASHHSQDANSLIEIDPHLRHLLVHDTPTDKGVLLPFGGLEIEWEGLELPEPFRAVNGDRISALGYHVIDCGHEKYTEIHPPVAVAVHRPRAVLLPGAVAFADNGPVEPLGTNVIVPGIVTDIWANLRGGQALNCESAAIHISARIGPPLAPVVPCVRQPTTAGKSFVFHIYLPPSPAHRLQQLGKTPAFVPNLHVSITDHPEAVRLGARRDVPVTIIEKRLEGDTPYVVIAVDISRMSTGQKFAKRISSAWVYPDLRGENFGLRALRARLNALKVTDDGEPFFKGDADWKLWVVLPAIDQPWTRLIDCGGCVEEKTYSPSSAVWKAGAIPPDGGLGGEMLLFSGQFGSIQFTGYEEDVLTSDDVGNVFDALSLLITRTARSTCNDQTVGGLSSLDPSTSGCAGYDVNYTVAAGRTPVAATVSPQATAAFQRLMVRSAESKQAPLSIESELYRNDSISAARRALTTERRGDFESWQANSTTARLGSELRTPEGEAMVKALRARVRQILGPQPTAKHRRKVAMELRELKKSVPPELYRKHLCDLETGTACPAP